ncbi:NAD-dependent epimerase/dehydratase family protein [Kribbella sp. NPDC049227]|uniref:NAD-dependent epimerase/dehydratase family protein n=1 Tax=Kribbella sp. NPDC049227 TaxID=3364113 RepID=UPI0037186450
MPWRPSACHQGVHQCPARARVRAREDIVEVNGRLALTSGRLRQEGTIVRVFVAGGTGVIGRPLVEALVGHGYEVTASSRRREGLPVVEQLGARPVLMDGLDEVDVGRVVAKAKPDVIVNLMTALSAPSHDYGTWLAVTNRLRSEGTRILIRAARNAGSRRLVAQSASFMTQPGSGLTDESAPPYLDGPGPIGNHIRANIAAENLLLEAAGIEGVVLRYGFLYGEGTAIGPGGDIVAAVVAGDMPIVGDGAGRYPFVHVRDAATITAQAVDRGDSGVYNVVDDEPAPQAEWLPYLARLLDAPPPRHISEEEAETQIGVQAVYYGSHLRAASNAKAKSELGFNPEYPSWRDGFHKLFG